MKSMETVRFSDAFVIGSGTVTVDLSAPILHVLVIYLSDRDEYILPKGRINIGEDWREAAVRETYEETRIRVELLPTSITTNATIPSTSATPGPVLHTEPFARTERLLGAEGDREKTTYWFAATADSTRSIPLPHAEPQLGEESFQPLWLPQNEALARLSFESDKAVASRLVDWVHKNMRTR